MTTRDHSTAALGARAGGSGANPAPGAARTALTKIVATVGPASSDQATLEKLIDAGASIFRLNFGHGTLDDATARVAAVRAAAAARGRQIAVLGDLQGPKLRLGAVCGSGERGAIEVEAGAEIVIERDEIACEATNPGEPLHLGTNHAGLVDDVEPGHRVLINDGAVRLLVVEKTEDGLRCVVRQGGAISSRKGINLPDTLVRVPALTDQDREHVEWSLRGGVDAFALSFVRSAEDVEGLRRAIAAAMPRGAPQRRVPIVAKIETPKAIEGIDGIVEASDAIMVARGDLGVEMDLADVPVIQKGLIAAARAWGKPCIVATQMFESMIHAPSPTRAEANDVAGAIFDEVDAVMLSGETAVGRYPVLAVEHMRRIAERTEAYLAAQPRAPAPPERLRRSRYRTAALAHGVWTVARDIDARVIVVWSQRGGGARYLSQNRFAIPIVALTSDEHSAREMLFMRGLIPLVIDVPAGLAELNRVVDGILERLSLASAGDTCILVAGEPLGTQGVTNSLAIHTVGDPRTGFAGH